jgi:hypothetical protein
MPDVPEPTLRFQFPLYKLFLIIAVYAAAFAAWSHLGTIGFVLAVAVGTPCSLLVIAIRDRKIALSAAIVAVGALVGAFFADVLFVPPVLNGYSAASGFHDWAVMSVGAALGGLVFSWASKR